MKHNKPLIQERGSLKTCRKKSTREQEQTYKKEPSKHYQRNKLAVVVALS